MRKIIVYNVISLDGYHTGPGNDVSVMFPMMGNVFDTYNRTAACRRLASCWPCFLRAVPKFLAEGRRESRLSGVDARTEGDVKSGPVRQDHRRLR